MCVRRATNDCRVLPLQPHLRDRRLDLRAQEAEEELPARLDALAVLPQLLEEARRVVEQRFDLRHVRELVDHRLEVIPGEAHLHQDRLDFRPATTARGGRSVSPGFCCWDLWRLARRQVDACQHAPSRQDQCNATARARGGSMVRDIERRWVVPIRSLRFLPTLRPTANGSRSPGAARPTALHWLGHADRGADVHFWYLRFVLAIERRTRDTTKGGAIIPRVSAIPRGGHPITQLAAPEEGDGRVLGRRGGGGPDHNSMADAAYAAPQRRCCARAGRTHRSQEGPRKTTSCVAVRGAARARKRESNQARKKERSENTER